MMISVCIFAHNEERHLPDCVAALDKAAGKAPYEAHILVNGAEDNTYGVAKALAAANPRISIHQLPMADKANAWNFYVHDLAPNACTHVFLDGDIRPSENALMVLRNTLMARPDAFAAAALPLSGRSRLAWATTLLVNHYLSGNLYALSDDALSAFRAKEIHLPVGATGEDGIISYLLHTDLKGGQDDTHKRRIAIASDASFEFDSLEASWRDLQTYHRRLQRYSERHFQKTVLYRRLKNHGVSAMPKAISEIYTADAVKELRPRLDPVNFAYDWATLRRLRAGPRDNREHRA